MDPSPASASDLANALLNRLSQGESLEDETRQQLLKAIADGVAEAPGQPDPIEDDADKQRRIAMAILTAYRCFNVQDAMQMHKIFEHRTSDCVQVSLPKSANIPDRNNKQYKKYLQDMVLNDLAPFKGEIDILQPVVSDAATRIAVAKVHGQVHCEGRLPIHDYTCWFFYFTESRDKVWKIETWVDSKQAYDFRQQLVEWRKKNIGPSATLPKSLVARDKTEHSQQ